MKTHDEIRMWTPFTKLLAFFILAGGGVIFYRLFWGIGAATNLNDRFPWGLWIGIDVLGGVAMAAGGFIIAGAVYILNWKKYKPIVRPAIFTAFFGYALAALAISLDIGLPWRIWHPMVMWQIHSIMWVVAIHVALYTTTLATESSPMFFEKFNMPRALKFVKKVMVPIVLFGVLLSVLHQSSLGAVFLIAPGRLHHLWYNSQIPTLFLISAIMMGLSMVSFENIVSVKAFKHEADMGILSGLARGCFITGTIYLILKIYFLASGPGIGAAFNGSMEANMYLVEMIIGVILPVALLSSKKIRNSLGSVFFVNILVIAGILINRFNVSIFGMYSSQSATGMSYFPSWMEFILSIGLISVAIMGFKMGAKYLRLFSEA